jgi:hypothetical protein
VEPDFETAIEARFCGIAFPLWETRIIFPLFITAHHFRGAYNPSGTTLDQRSH